jgi:LuxR family maltose regulon positive regulatory protein
LPGGAAAGYRDLGHGLLDVSEHRSALEGGLVVVSGPGDRPTVAADALDGASADVAARLGVLATKLVPPRVRPGIIERGRLVARLEAVPTPMVALIGPAGYGKSTVAAAYARAIGRPVAWLSIDGRDRDPATLVRGLAAALSRVRALDATVLDAITDPGPTPWSVAVPALTRTVAALPRPTIVIDDVDRLDDDEAVDVLLSVVAALPDGGRMIVAGRSAGRLPWPRLESSGILTTVGRDDLAFEPAETAELLAALGLDAAVDAAAVTTATEGWAAGVYLRALALRVGAAEPHPDEASVAPTAPARLIEEYLRSEVLGPLAADDADLLVRASLVERWSGELCDAMLERTGSGAALDRLERSNLFVIALDAERVWYRPHHLLGEVFRADVERRAPDEARALLGRAARWHEAHGLPESALEYAMQAGDEALAARLTERLAQPALNSGRLDTARRWFTWFDEAGAGARMPRFTALATLLFSMSGDAPMTERWAAIGATAAAAASGPDAGALAVARCCYLRDGVAAMLADGELAVRLLPDDDQLAVAGRAALGMAQAFAGRPAAAEATLRSALDGWQVDTTVNMAGLVALVQLTAIALDDGDVAAADEHMRWARRTLVANHMTEQPIASMVDALDARVALAHGATEPARRSLVHAQRLRAQTGLAAPWMAMRARLDLIRAMVILGDGGGARTLMAEVDDVLRRRPDLGTLVSEARTLRDRLEALRGGAAGASSLTMAELRLLPLLTTHLTFREIGQRLFVSPNTVKTQAISIYRKLDASSRSEAIERATDLGLIGTSGAAPSAADFIPPG